MKKVTILLVAVLLLTGCSTKQTGEIIESEVSSSESLGNNYYPIVQFEPNTGRNEYYNNFNLSNDFQTISRELEIMSTSYFSTDKYYMSDGQELSYGDINDDLLLWRTEELPYALQPEKDEEIGGETSVIMTSSVYELDFYQKDGDTYNLSGASFAIVIDPLTKTESGELVSIKDKLSDQYIEEFSKYAIETLYKYIQEDERYESLKGVPILTAVYYATDPDVSKNSGSYIYKAYHNGGVGEVTAVDYQQVIFTSSDAEVADPITSSEFLQFKNALKSDAVEAVGAVGYGRYNDGDLSSLEIKITANVKTYVELEYIVSIATSEVDSRFTTPVPITVTIYSQDKLEAVIIKQQGQNAISQMLY